MLYPQAVRLIEQMVKAYSTNEELSSLLSDLRHRTQAQCSAEGVKPGGEQGKKVAPGHNLLVYIGAAVGVACVMAATAAAAHLQYGQGSLAAACWASGTWGPLRAMAISIALAISLILRLLSVSIYPVALVDMAFNIPRVGGDIAHLQLSEFNFLSLVEHFWESKAYICSILLFTASLLVATLVILLVLAIWVTPIFSHHRRPVLILAGFLVRMATVDIIFFSLCMPVLDQDVQFPLDLTVKLRNHIEIGVLCGDISLLINIALCQYFISSFCMEQESGRLSYRHGALDMLRVAQALFIFIGITIWFSSSFLSCTVTDFAGAFLPPGRWSGCGLVVAAFKSNTAFGIAVVLTSFVAPLAQGFGCVGFILLANRNSKLIASYVSKFGDVATNIDVFAVCFFSAFLPEVDGFARWIARDKCRP